MAAASSTTAAPVAVARMKPDAHASLIVVAFTEHAHGVVRVAGGETSVSESS